MNLEKVNGKENVAINEGFGIVCVWPSTLMPEAESRESSIEEFEKFFLDNLQVRVQFLEQIFTKPDKGDVSGETGGRSDIFFALHNEDVAKFTLPRFQYDIRWLEDVVARINGYHKNPLYPGRILDYLEQ